MHTTELLRYQAPQRDKKGQELFKGHNKNATDTFHRNVTIFTLGLIWTVLTKEFSRLKQFGRGVQAKHCWVMSKTFCIQKFVDIGDPQLDVGSAIRVIICGFLLVKSGKFLLEVYRRNIAGGCQQTFSPISTLIYLI